MMALEEEEISLKLRKVMKSRGHILILEEIDFSLIKKIIQ